MQLALKLKNEILRRKEMLEELKIDPEFEKVIPPLTKDEYHQLEENILDDGRIMMPIAVWGGHHCGRTQSLPYCP